MGIFHLNPWLIISRVSDSVCGRYESKLFGSERKARVARWPRSKSQQNGAGRSELGRCSVRPDHALRYTA